jgi:hypothetical protein
MLVARLAVQPSKHGRVDGWLNRRLAQLGPFREIAACMGLLRERVEVCKCPSSADRPASQ